MSNNLHQPPNWWHHSSLTWNELVNFFPAEKLATPSCWHKLPEGFANHNYQFCFAKQRYFIQIVNTYNTQLLPHPINKSHSKTISIFNYLINNSIISPWLVECFINTEIVRVFKWVDVESISSYFFGQTSFEQKPLLAAVYRFITHLHNLDVAPQQLKQLPNIEIEPYLQRYYRLAMLKSKEQSEQIEVLFQTALKLSKDFSATTICHNDLRLDNFLWNKSSSTLKIIDWEYASRSDPIMDIAGLIINCQLDQTQEASFIEYYTNQLAVNISPSKLENMKQLYQHLSSLWHLASH